MKLKDFCDFIVGVSELYSFKLSEAVIEIYYDVLKEYEFDVVKKSIYELIKTSKFMPKPAEILEQINGNPDEKALIAWQKVMKAIETQGYYETVRFDDVVISACVKELGGWTWLCEQEKSQLAFIEKRFKDIYTLRSKVDTQDNGLLIGSHDAKNANDGHFAYLSEEMTALVGKTQGNAISAPKTAIDGDNDSIAKQNIDKIKEILR